MGEAVALLGRNGAGKTTVIRSIVGFTPPRAGRVPCEDEPPSRDGRPTASPGAASRWCRRAGGSSRRSPCGRTSLSARGTRAGRSSACFELFPRLRERQAQAGGTLSGRRAADARDRPRAPHQRRASSCSTSRRRGWRRSSCARSARSCARLKGEGLVDPARGAELPPRPPRRRPRLRHEQGTDRVTRARPPRSRLTRT